MKKPAGLSCQRASLPSILFAALGKRPLTRHRVAKVAMVMCQYAPHMSTDEEYNDARAPVNPNFSSLPVTLPVRNIPTDRLEGDGQVLGLKWVC